MTFCFPEPRSAYIHVPFCAHRCGYCDFTLVARKDRLADDYLRAMAIELRQLEYRRTVDTIFLGGGTPTHLRADQLAQLFEMLFEWFEPTPQAEISIEANPAGLTQDKIDRLTEFGVNRISLGVQSFDASTLSVLERDHRAADIRSAVEQLQQQFRNISLDLIFGVPGQSLETWQETLHEAIALGPQHLSTYGLTFEKGTAFWSRRDKGQLQPADDELERSMYSTAMERLEAVGFAQYEISSFAQPDFRCRHNEVYWQGLPYFGFGPGAARYINGCRETNHRSVTTWLKRVFAGESPIADAETLSPEDRGREAIVLGLRRCQGVDRGEFHTVTGLQLDALAGPTVEKFCRLGLLEDTGATIRLTHAGRFVADSVIIEFL